MEKHKADLTWLKAICPICGKLYEYTILHKPKTCGNFSCIINSGKIWEKKDDSI